MCFINIPGPSNTTQDSQKIRDKLYSMFHIFCLPISLLFTYKWNLEIESFGNYQIIPQPDLVKSLRA